MRIAGMAMLSSSCVPSGRYSLTKNSEKKNETQNAKMPMIMPVEKMYFSIASTRSFSLRPVITNSRLHGVGLSINERLDKATRVEKHAVRRNGNSLHQE